MTAGGLRKAVVLAAGQGSRMSRPDPGAALDAEQEAAASSGLKGLMPFKRPFLDYVLSGLADAGMEQVCLVVGPGHGAIRERYTRIAPPERLSVAFAVQQRPLGTADALLAAERFAGGDHFLALNADNLYPPAAYRALADLPGAGLAVFRKETLIERGGIPEERVRQYALAVVGENGFLRRILEKPDRETFDSLAGQAWISMNLWRLSPAIFEACRQISPSARGELELPAAVDHAVVVLGQRLRAVPCAEGVLDLSTRADVSEVARRLAGVEARP
jgi:dTDP-glucose pyrophosphorylase